MAFVFIGLSLILCITTFKVWRDHIYQELTSNLVALTLGFIAFNAILGLLLLFDGLESNSNSLIRELVQQPGTISILIICVMNGLFYSVFTLLFLTKSGQSTKRK